MRPCARTYVSERRGRHALYCAAKVATSSFGLLAVSRQVDLGPLKGLLTPCSRLHRTVKKVSGPAILVHASHYFLLCCAVLRHFTNEVDLPPPSLRSDGRASHGLATERGFSWHPKLAEHGSWPSSATVKLH